MVKDSIGNGWNGKVKNGKVLVGKFLTENSLIRKN